ncbi:MAG: NDP-sugar synthase, partial [Actinobacteria bacterium]|nr:NDP-sugar synthase [Actinomycetota bacterium]
MKAVVLVGGEGTRLRPLTETIPKPLLPLVDRAFLHHVLDHLSRHGVREVILSSPYLEAAFVPFVRERRGDPAVTWITERTPLGTGGAIANAARRLTETFLALNGDILTDLDLTELLARHRESGATATITLSPVEDARAFGLVSLDDSGRVREFREKPAERATGLVNAGTYVLEPDALSGVPLDGPVSIERETFPALIAAGRPVFGHVSRAYWMDLGTPGKYLQATFDVLEGRVGGLDYPAPFLAETAEVSLRAHLGRWVVVGPDARVGDDAEVEDSILLWGSTVEEGARVRGSILGPNVRVGRKAEVTGALLAEGAIVPPGVRADSPRVPPGQV